MRNVDDVLKKANTLYEDETYLLVWTKLFGLSLLALTSYYVYVKPKKRLVKLNSKEKVYLMGVSYYLTNDFKVTPQGVINETSLFKDFSHAIADRGGEFYQAFFKHNSKEKAQIYASQTTGRFRVHKDK